MARTQPLDFYEVDNTSLDIPGRCFRIISSNTRTRNNPYLHPVDSVVYEEQGLSGIAEAARYDIQGCLAWFVPKMHKLPGKKAKHVTQAFRIYYDTKLYALMKNTDLLETPALTDIPEIARYTCFLGGVSLGKAGYVLFWKARGIDGKPRLLKYNYNFKADFLGYTCEAYPTKPYRLDFLSVHRTIVAFMHIVIFPKDRTLAIETESVR